MDTIVNEIGGSVDYVITGKNLEVKEEIRRLLDRFPTQGYNTRVVKIDIISETEISAKLSRWNSCD